MDFTLTLQIGSIVTAGILVISAAEFGRSIYGIRGDVSSSTFRALVFFGAASLALGLIVINTTFVAGTIGQRTWIALFLVFIIVSEVHVATDSKRAHRGIYVVAIFALSAAALVAMQSPSEVSPILATALAIAVTTAILFGAWLIYDSPSPFTVGLLLLLGAFLASWSIITQGVFVQEIDVSSFNLFLILFLPGMVASSIMISMLKPWRQILTSFIVFTSIMTATSIGLAALLTYSAAVDLQIAVFVFATCIIVVSSTASVDFFLEQSAETNARIPLYMALTLVSIAGLLVLHMLFYPMLLLTGINEDPLLSYIQWILGMTGTATFVIGGFYSVITKKTVGYLRRGLLIFIAVMAVLANPVIRSDSLGVTYRWVYDDLFPYLLGVILVGVVGYMLVVRRLRRVGSHRAARNFMSFAFSALATAAVIFFSDDLPYVVIVGLIVVLGSLMLSSSPRRIAGDTR